ncbi:MAG: serpin family protein, partial [Longimicrobiaceae bacterium]
LTAAEQEVVAASNSFAFDLFRELSSEQPDSNVFISPLSASMALGMTLNGARGETFDAMRSTLGFDGLSQSEINASYRSLIDLLRGLDPKVEMLIGNSIWYRDTFPFEQAFFDTTETYFDAEVAGLDFTDPASVDVINAWVNESTEGKIEDIVEAPLPPDVVMYLINAIYFKGDWTDQFSKDRTHDAPFTTSDGGTVTVKLMHRPEAELQHVATAEYEAVDLSYGRGAFAMTVVLPAPDGNVNDLIRTLDAESWSEIANAFEERTLDLYLPRFRLEYEKSFNDALEALGMGIAFGPEQDFTGMSPANPFISEVFQKTYVNVNEEGTTAAAVTKVSMNESAPPSFRADRPFIFAIRERFSGAILFIGKMEEPPAG